MIGRHLIISGSGEPIYDPEVCLQYRQHSKSIFGANVFFKAKFKRFFKLLSGEYTSFIDENLNFLKLNENFLTKENRKVLNYIILSKKSKLFKRIYYFFKAGAYRFSFLENLIIFLCLLINKI